MRHGIRQGHGTCNFADGSKYIGAWFDGARHGQGTFTDCQGNHYSGAWREDEMYGDGEMTMSNDGRKMTGWWVKGKLQG